MKRQYTLDDLRVAVAESRCFAEVYHRLDIRGGGSQGLAKRKIQSMGFSTAHFSGPPQFLPKSRKKHPNFVCKMCGRVVVLEQGDHLKAYCSDNCMAQGRPVAIRAALVDPNIRQQMREAQIASWANNRQGRLTARLLAQELQVNGTRRAAQNPGLRAKRSENAKKRWDSDPEFVRKFQAASIKARRQKVLTETCARKPHIHLYTCRGLTMVRSKWERDFGIWLDHLGLEWVYEPVRVIVDGRPYTPDFLVSSPFGPCYVEVHRLETAPMGDTKLRKIAAAAPLLRYPVVLVSETEIYAIRKHLRCIRP